MQNVLKTKDVSQLLGVSPKTVLSWVKNHKIACQKNEQGHYLFNAANIEELKSIQQQLYGEGIKEQTAVEKEEMVPRHVFNRKMKEMMAIVEEMQYQLNEKADAVVSYQLLNHRAEIEEMNKLLAKLEQRVANVERMFAETTKETKHDVAKRRSFMQIFST